MIESEANEILLRLRDELEAVISILESEPPAGPQRLYVHATDQSERMLRADGYPVAVDCDLDLETAEMRSDALYADALVVVTDFGEATEVLLQMWLSIPVSRAQRILRQLERDGLITRHGRVLRKAHAARASFAGNDDREVSCEPHHSQ